MNKAIEKNEQALKDMGHQQFNLMLQSDTAGMDALDGPITYEGENAM